MALQNKLQLIALWRGNNVPVAIFKYTDMIRQARNAAKSHQRTRDEVFNGTNRTRV